MIGSSRLTTPALCLLLTVPAVGCNTPQSQLPPPKPAESSPEPSAEGLSKLVWRPSKVPITRDLAESLALPEAEFHLGLSLLLFAKEHGGASIEKVEANLLLINSWQERVNYLTRHMRTNEERLDALRIYIHDALEFRFDSSDPRGFSLDNLMFDRVMERRRGYCLTLSMLYVLLGPAAGVRLAPVRMPAHFAVIDLHTDPPMMIEATNRGLPLSRIGAYTKYRMSVQSVEVNNVFMSPITGREVFSSFYGNLAAVASLRGDDTAAMQHAERAVNLSANNVDARYNYATLLAKGTDAASIQSSLREINDILRLDPNFYRGYTRRAAIKARHGDRNEAMNDLRKAKAMRPDLPHADLEEGVIRYNDGDITGAKACFEAALALDANHPDALRNLSAVELELGNTDRAKELESRWHKAMGAK